MFEADSVRAAHRAAERGFAAFDQVTRRIGEREHLLTAQFLNGGELAPGELVERPPNRHRGVFEITGQHRRRRVIVGLAQRIVEQNKLRDR